MTQRKRKKILLVALNMPHEYSLALHYLKLYALKEPEVIEKAEIDILEIKVSKSMPKIVSKILKRRPDLVAFSCCIWNISRTLKVARLIKLFTRVPIIFGGQEVTNSYINYLGRYRFIDIIIDGEGEATFSELVKDFVNSGFRNLKDIEGIHYRKDSKIYRNPLRSVIKELDTIPSPYLNKSIRVKPSHHLGMMIELTRGCTHRCRFCFEGSRYNSARSFSIERVRKELEFAKKNGITKFHFLDPILANAGLSKLKELNQIINSLFKENDRYYVPVEVYAEYINEKNVECFRPFSAFDVGLQSINPQIQANINRKFNLERFLKGFQLLKKLNKETNVYILVGLPGDNYFSLMKTIRHVVRIKPTFLYTNYLYLLNGSYMREDIKKNNIKFKPIAPYEVISNNTFSKNELKIARLMSETTMKEHNLNLTLYKKITS